MLYASPLWERVLQALHGSYAARSRRAGCIKDDRLEIINMSIMPQCVYVPCNIYVNLLFEARSRVVSEYSIICNKLDAIFPHARFFGNVIMMSFMVGISSRVICAWCAIPFRFFSLSEFMERWSQCLMDNELNDRPDHDV